jgi:hypothetical protein
VTFGVFKIVSSAVKFWIVLMFANSCFHPGDYFVLELYIVT